MRSSPTVGIRSGASLSATVSNRPPPPCAGGSVLVDGAQLESTFAPDPCHVVVVILRAPRFGLKPFATQPDPSGELVELLRRVRLEVPAAGPPSPIADREGVIDVNGQAQGPRARGKSSIPPLALARDGVERASRRAQAARAFN